jgi:sugar transferase (PEP-CTERM/EpsH1 system associated)
VRILVLAHRIPYPPHTGDKLRAYHIARYLSGRHEVTLGFVIDDPRDAAEVDALRAEISDLEFAQLSQPWTLARYAGALASGTALSLAHFGSSALQRRITTRLRGSRYDLVYLSSSPMAQYVSGGHSVPVVMDFVDVDSDKWTQYAERVPGPLGWIYRSEGRRLRRYEAEVARWARMCIVATAAEETLLRSFAPWARTAVIPNGIDLAHFAPSTSEPTSPTLLFTGAMDYLPNVDAMVHFCHDILPLVRRESPGTRLLIVGLNPASRVARLARIPGVVVTGTVADVRGYYAQAQVCVAPLRLGRGVQNKVIQGMAMGLPVVATSAAARGLEARAGHHLHVADDPVEFARCVVRLLRDPGERRRVGGAARAFVEEHHAWEASLTRLERLLGDVAGQPAAEAVTA